MSAGVRSRSFVQVTAHGGGAATETAPTDPPTAATAFPLAGVRSFRVTVYADESETLGGAGTIQYLLWNPNLEAWCWNETLTKTVGTGGTRAEVFEDEEAADLFEHQEGWFLFPRIVAVDATGNGGTNITVRVDGAL